MRNKMTFSLCHSRMRMINEFRLCIHHYPISVQHYFWGYFCSFLNIILRLLFVFFLVSASLILSTAKIMEKENKNIAGPRLTGKKKNGKHNCKNRHILKVREYKTQAKVKFSI